jgi:hydroxymethylpyrimidine pyrophosphatase-like HAD family hydrolase
MKVVGPNKYVLVRIDYRAAQRGAGTRVSAQQIVEGFGRTAAECIAFGSGAQSVDMLRWAGCGVSMGGVEVPSVTAAAADVATLGVPGVSIYDALHFG